MENWVYFCGGGKVKLVSYRPNFLGHWERSIESGGKFFIRFSWPRSSVCRAEASDKPDHQQQRSPLFCVYSPGVSYCSGQLRGETLVRLG